MVEEHKFNDLFNLVRYFQKIVLVDNELRGRNYRFFDNYSEYVITKLK